MNIVTLLGAHVQSELRYTPTGLPVADVTLAGSAPRAWYHAVTVFGGMAEILAEIPQGIAVMVTGRLQQDRWEGKDGSKRSKVKVIADQVRTLGTLPTEADAKGQPRLVESINTVTLSGNATRDAETRDTDKGPVANASIAINSKRKNEDVVDYFDIATFDATETLAAIRKGDGLVAIGPLVTRSWEGKDGNRHYRTEVIAENVWRVVKGSQGPQEARGAPTAGGLDIDADDKGLPF